MSHNSAEQFYDEIADKYSWFFSSRSRRMQMQADEIVPALERFGVKTVLDCSCGDGFQAIPLAMCGYKVDCGDISENMLKKVAEYAEEANVKINFKKADFRQLELYFSDKYDCVLSCGNSIPHLMTDDDIKMALRSIYGRLNAGGIAYIEMRNYDALLQEKPRFLPMRINDTAGLFRYSILYVLDYFPNAVQFNVIYLIENTKTGEKHMEQSAVNYNPVKKNDFIRYLTEAGFVNIEAAESERNIRYIARKL